MGVLNLPLLMVAAFLLLTLGIGLCFTRISTSFREYALGDQAWHTAPLMGTLLTLIYGGGRLMVGVEQVHNFVLAWVFFILLTSFLPHWVISWLALRMTPFMRNLSMSDSIGRVYGRYPRIITGFANICFVILTIAIQINVMSQSISMCSDLFALLKFRFDCFIPIVTAPFILAVLGFRGGSSTALMGMAAGIVTILAWNRWIEPTTAMNGSFIAMVVNGLVMRVVHYVSLKLKT